MAGKIEGLQQKLQATMQDLMADTDVKRIRPLSKRVFLCQAKCCDSGSSQESWNNCLEQCAVPLQQSKQVVESEIGSFQQRLQQCAQQCQNAAQNYVQDNQIQQSDTKGIEKVQANIGACVSTCLTDHMKLVPAMSKRIDDNLKRIQAP